MMKRPQYFPAAPAGRAFGVRRMRRHPSHPGAADSPAKRVPIWSCAAALAVCLAGCAPDGAAPDDGAGDNAEATEPRASESSDTAATESAGDAAGQAEQPHTAVAAGGTFLDENATREGVVTTASGLQYEVLVSGSGATPGATDTVTTHYHGTFEDGRVFDSSVERGVPASFPVDRVIAGWTEALQMMRVGDKWRIVCPPDLAYGERGRGGIPPNSTLVFEVELLGIEPSG